MEEFTGVTSLKGGLISYPWERFIEDFGIAPNFDPRGMTYALAEKRIAESKYRTLEQFVAEVRKNYAA